MSALLDMLRAGKKPVVGMVQLAALPGGSRYRGGGIDEVIVPALKEAEILASHGVDALMVQNLGDIPTDLQVTNVQVAWMTRVVSEVQRRTARPTGLNMLENDAEAMIAVASAANADFVRIKIYVGAMVTPFVYKLPFEYLSCFIADQQNIAFLGFDNKRRQEVNFRQIFHSAQAKAEPVVKI